MYNIIKQYFKDKRNKKRLKLKEEVFYDIAEKIILNVGDGLKEIVSTADIGLYGEEDKLRIAINLGLKNE